MLILNDWHPDIFNFINSKRQSGKITNANISVGVSDKLMDAVHADADWELVFPDTRDPEFDELWDGDLDTWVARGRKVVPYKTIKARELWDAIIESAWTSAEPGVWFRERSNKMANSWYFNPQICTNPCGEQPLGAFSVCNLGAINLSKFYDASARDVAWDQLRRTVAFATRFLDNVIDTTPYFFEENRKVQMSERRVGLGTMGIAELMLKLGVRYGSDESVAVIDDIYRTIAVTAYETSSDLAREKGAFPMFEAEKFLESGFMQAMPAEARDKIRRDGIRNVTLLTQAPTGTTGTMVNTSTGVEPFFSWVYYRKSRLGLHEEQVPIVKIGTRRIRTRNRCPTTSSRRWTFRRMNISKCKAPSSAGSTAPSPRPAMCRMNTRSSRSASFTNICTSSAARAARFTAMAAAMNKC